ncbi:MULTISPECIES: hypothetical protein [Gulbenkiania]|uniref:Cyclic di-GMP receptor atypical PilZ domain-containing protein n=2 Tax=Gulbenkiania TaxID=397456 RepID=A0A0K6GSJ0_9NEIS|nr:MULTISPECIES: hypothetical protein [Gulbenkiania]TCW32227.1 hypothetical protein EV669_103143 [Gulbenkiania mobilis]CUA81496.1 hypothetical protein Ga0061063_0338 [Gulbenkiania indica]
MLPQLETVSFDGELPLMIGPAANGPTPPRLVRETRLALRVLAAPTELHEDSDPLLIRLEAKIDLALELTLVGYHRDEAHPTPCRVGLHQLAWLADTVFQPGDTHLFTLAPHTESALTLHLTGHIVACQPAGERFAVLADIRHAFDEHTLLMWEKWVFRRHRQAIHQR